MMSKSDLRRTARQARKAVGHIDIGLALAEHVEQLKLAPGAIVGGYHALPDEADPALLLKELVARGCHVAFPRIAGKGMPLDFHLVPDGEMLAPGVHGIHEPLPTWPLVTPHLLLVPLLAFDSRGHRLGHGAGFYDRTLDLLSCPRHRHCLFGPGDRPRLPAEPHDMALDGILTEQGFRAFS